MAQAWGGGLLAAVDGVRFVVPVRSIDARPNPRYFGRRRGVTLLNLVNDQAVGLAGQVVSGNDMVCGLMRLLGFDYLPQLADLPDAKLWRINLRWRTSCSMLVQASAASCWVVGSSTAAAVPLSLSARRDSERASRAAAP